MKQNKYIKNIHLRSKQLVEDEKEKQKQSKSQVELQEFDYASKPYENFDYIDLTGIRSIKISESGSRGVFFIDTEKGAIVLKLSGQVGVELFLNNLALALKIKTTKMKVLKWCDEEMQLAQLQILHSASYDEVLTHRIKQKLKVAYFEMIEYVPGIHLYLLTGERAQLAFTEERLLSLGKILAFDIFINNGDRFPLPVWRSVGNAYNVILKVTDAPAQELFNIKNTDIVFDEFYAIDPQTILRALGGNSVQEGILKTYQDKVRQFLNDICTEIKEQRSRSLEIFQNFIFEQTQYKLSNDQLLIISRGILQQLLIIINFGIQGFKDVLQTAFIPDAHNWGNYNSSLEMIHVDFHNQMIDIFKEIYEKNKELYSTL